MLKKLIVLLLVPCLSFAAVPKDFPPKLIKAAEHYKNVRESQGDNRSPDIDSMLKDLGLPVGLSWCLAFVQRCWKDACAGSAVKNPMPKGVARVSTLLKIAEQNPYVWKVKSYKSLMVGSRTAKAGDMTIHISGRNVSADENFNGHIGLLAIPGDFKNVGWTWEGNTGPETHAKFANAEQERNAAGKLAGVHFRFRPYGPGSNFRIAYLIEPVTI